MRILLTGGTGFIGKALTQILVQQNHQLTVLSRQAKRDTQTVKFIQNVTHLENLDSFDAIINLAGEPIFSQAWTTKRKNMLYQSRIDVTQKLVELCQKSKHPPHIFISASATGYYGNLPNGADNLTEQTIHGDGFSAQLCREWEKVAQQAQSSITRVCLLRTGMVFDVSGGALKQMLPLYRLGIAGKLGSGKQYWAWISLADHLRAICFLLEHSHAQGAFNLVAPNPIRNMDFNQLLAEKLNRPAFFGVPTFLLKWILGERSRLLLDNQPLCPHNLMALGFTFKHNELKQWLAESF